MLNLPNKRWGYAGCLLLTISIISFANSPNLNYQGLNLPSTCATKAAANKLDRSTYVKDCSTFNNDKATPETTKQCSSSWSCKSITKKAPWGSVHCKARINSNPNNNTSMLNCGTDGW